MGSAVTGSKATQKVDARGGAKLCDLAFGRGSERVETGKENASNPALRRRPRVTFPTARHLVCRASPGERGKIGVRRRSWREHRRLCACRKASITGGAGVANDTCLTAPKLRQAQAERVIAKLLQWHRSSLFPDGPLRGAAFWGHKPLPIALSPSVAITRN
jgi:hypothetical protein